MLAGPGVLPYWSHKIVAKSSRPRAAKREIAARMDAVLITFGAIPINFAAHRVAIWQIATPVDANLIGTGATAAAISQIAAGMASV
jgi:hypothetical protein